MELAKAELAAVEVVVTTGNSAPAIELSDLQLALVGGGVGDVILV